MWWDAWLQVMRAGFALRSSHKTGKHALYVSIVSSKEESLSSKIDEGYTHFVLWCMRSSLSAYRPSSYDNQCAILLRSFKNSEDTHKQEEVWSENSWLLPYTKAKLHTAFIVKEFLEKLKIEVFIHREYKTDLAPYDFCLFWSPKMVIAE